MSIEKSLDVNRYESITDDFDVNILETGDIEHCTNLSILSVQARVYDNIH